MTPTCPACALTLQTASRFCPRCGSALPASAHFPPAVARDAHLQGIGGWLIVVAINLGMTTLYLARNIMHTDLDFLAPRRPGSIMLVGVFLLCKDVLTLAMLVWLNWLFYNSKRIFPRARIAYYIWMIVANLMAMVLVGVTQVHTRGALVHIRFVIALAFAAIWVPYFLVSRRVKATFIH